MVVPDPKHVMVVLSGILVNKPCSIAIGRGSVGYQSINVDINLGETMPVGNKKRFPLRFNLNSKESDYGIGSDFRNACWTRKRRV